MLLSLWCGRCMFPDAPKKKKPHSTVSGNDELYTTGQRSRVNS